MSFSAAADTLAPGLYLVATPIGNARDITLRALDCLGAADVLVAEDTRSLRRLLDMHGVPLGGRPLLSYHDHSGDAARRKVLDHLGQNRAVVYCSEAGTPLIADPGYGLVRDASEAGHLVTSAPGAVAAITALSLSGLPTDRFFFEGFLPSASGARRKRLDALSSVPGTLVFYESPKRLERSLEDMVGVWGGSREAALARELTKRFEEVRRAPLDDLLASCVETPPRGECVLLVAPASATEMSDAEVTVLLTKALETSSAKQAVADITALTGRPRRVVYQEALRILGKS